MCKDIKNMVFGHMVNVAILRQHFNLTTLTNLDSYTHISTVVASIEQELENNIATRKELATLVKIQCTLEVLLWLMVQIC